jgi:hypothetical protein
VVFRDDSLSNNSRAVWVIVFALSRGDDDDDSGCWLIVSVKCGILSVYTFT